MSLLGFDPRDTTKQARRKELVVDGLFLLGAFACLVAFYYLLLGET